jgi:hypothetical protein
MVSMDWWFGPKTCEKLRLKQLQAPVGITNMDENV